MEWISITFLVSSAVLIGILSAFPKNDSEDLSIKCLDGTVWMDECNTCSCVNGYPACTQIDCFRAPTRDSSDIESGLARIASEDSSKRCFDGTVWMDDCNTCTCVNGIPNCTQVDCLKAPIRHSDIESAFPRNVSEESSKNCLVGTVWMDDCNTCSCVNGVPKCTQMDCSKAPTKHSDIESAFPGNASEESSNRCLVGTVWMDNCNTCSCVNGVPHCTKKNCLNRRTRFTEKCTCDPRGSSLLKCVNGHCICDPYYTGQKCDTCIEGHGGPNCNVCDCDPVGSVSNECNEFEDCVCLPNFAGYKCRKCQPNYKGHYCDECAPGYEIPGTAECKPYNNTVDPYLQSPHLFDIKDNIFAYVSKVVL